MEDREIMRQRAFVIGVAAAVAVTICALAVFVVAICSDLDLRIRGAGQEQAQETDADDATPEGQGDGSQVLSEAECVFVSFLADNAWVDALGETSVSFTESEIILLRGGEEERWEYELVSLEVEPAAEGVSRQAAVLLVGGAERNLTIEAYEPVWSYEQNAYDGPYSDCCLSFDFLEVAYYRHIADASAPPVAVLPAELVAEVFGESQSQLASSIDAYCKADLPDVTEVTYTGEFLIDSETGVERHLFTCKGASNVLLTATFNNAEQRFVIERAE